NQPVQDASEGRYPDGADEWFKFISPTKGIANLTPAPRGVIINEIMYHPAGAADPGPEYLELRNTTGSDIVLANWTFSNAIDYIFRAGAVVHANGYVVVAGDPALVQSTYGITGVLGPYSRKLSNNSDEIELKDQLGNRVDFVEYQQEGLWPTAPDGSG